MVALNMIGHSNINIDTKACKKMNNSHLTFVGTVGRFGTDTTENLAVSSTVTTFHCFCLEEHSRL